MKKSKNLNIIGQSVPRVDATDKLTGKALYAGDIFLPGMLHLKLLRSDRPHAKIMNIQTEQAETHPGVVAVFTYKDIPVNRILPDRPDQPLLCDEKVRYVGDPVALVAAENEASAEEAVSLIRVEYEDLPGVFSPEEALLPDAPLIHEKRKIAMEIPLLKGNVEQGLKDSAVVITNTYRTQMVEHAYLEPDAGVASYEEGKLTVWMPTKSGHADRDEIASVLGLPVGQVRVADTTIGGSFGDKGSLSPGYYAALASLSTRRPAKMVYSREETFIGTRKRHPFTIDYTTGATREGRIVAVKVEIIADAGAYKASTAGVFTKAVLHATGPYCDVPNVFVRARGIYTNHPVTGSMRGLGVPQIAVAHESQIDSLAEALHLDPFEVRLKNALRPSSFTATGQCLNESVGLTETITKVREEISRRGTPKASGSKRYGWGIASMYYGICAPGHDNTGRAVIVANDSGDFELYVGCRDVGQGSSTAMAQIAAEVLNCKMGQIRMIVADTDSCLDAGVSSASRVTYAVGRSVEIAAQKLKELLKRSAASLIEIASQDLRFENGFFYHAEAPGLRISVAQAVKRLKEVGLSCRAEGVFVPDVNLLDPKTGQGNPMPTYVYATQGALVSVDIDSGEVEVLSCLASHDVGKVVNLAGVTGQIEGAVSMGLGYALMEEVLLKNGRILNPSFSKYYIATSLDMPEIKAILVETEEPSGPFGAKGVGEPAMIPTAPAILNAINAAIGFRAKELPVTSEKVWRFLCTVPEKGTDDLGTTPGVMTSEELEA